jgi:RNA polymerase sigma factor (sigma-70 family)
MTSDSDLLTAWRNGDATAGEQLLGRHFAPIARFFRSKFGDDVQDLVQQTFLDCLNSKDRITDSFRSYLFGIARNQMMNHLRMHYRGKQIDPLTTSIVELKTSPRSAAVRDQQKNDVAAAMRRLSIDHQVILELTYWEHMSGNEIAAALSIDANTVRSRLARARDELRGLLAETN